MCHKGRESLLVLAQTNKLWMASSVQVHAIYHSSHTDINNILKKKSQRWRSSPLLLREQTLKPFTFLVISIQPWYYRAYETHVLSNWRITVIGLQPGYIGQPTKNGGRPWSIRRGSVRFRLAGGAGPQGH
jgi:hypothetical protein